MREREGYWAREWTSTPSIGCPLQLNLGWTSTEFISSFTVAFSTNEVLYIVSADRWGVVSSYEKSKVRASPALFCVIVHLKIGWKKVQRCWFNSAKISWHFCIVDWGQWKAQQCAPCERERERERGVSYYDLIATPCFWLANHNDWSRWSAISSLPPICSPPFKFYGWVCKNVNN
jgi:hypothetical protein